MRQGFEQALEAKIGLEDAIEKACELLDEMICSVTYVDLEGSSAQHYDKTEFIEDFKNYMKEEGRQWKDTLM